MSKITMECNYCGTPKEVSIPDNVYCNRECMSAAGGPGKYKVLKTECIHGHEYNEKNTYWFRGIHRQCRACNRANQVVIIARRKAIQETKEKFLQESGYYNE